MAVPFGPRQRVPLLALGAVLAMVAGAAGAKFQERKDPPRFRSTVVELTDQAPADWILKEAKTGTPIVSDRGYALAELPDEIQGGTLLVRTSGDDSKEWLKPGSLRALKDATVYVLIRSRYLGKDVMGEVAQTKLEREGWKEVGGETGTTFPAGEDWRWKGYKKAVKKGDVLLQLRTLSWEGWFVLFIVK